MRGFGAMPPDSLSWQIGKTAGSITFVNRAETAVTKLQEVIKKIKSGKMTVEGDLSVEDFLKRDF